MQNTQKRLASTALKRRAGPPSPAVAEPPKPSKPSGPPEVPPAHAPESMAQALAEPTIEAEPSVQEFSFDAPEVVAAGPEPILAAPVEPIIAEPVVSEIPLAPVPIDAAPVAQAPPATPSHEIDISNDWEEMIEVEP